MKQTMERKEWRFLERKDWSAGPWDNEPDKVQWTDEQTDLPCLAVRNHLGGWCGYVGVGPDHPFYGVEYSACRKGCEDSWHCEHSPEAVLSCHGGITFSNFCDEANKEQGICHAVKNDPRFWFGFDCGHAGDLLPLFSRNRLIFGDEVYRDLKYVETQCANLALQLSDLPERIKSLS